MANWLQAHEKAGLAERERVTNHKPSPAALPSGKARVRAFRTGHYDNRLVEPGEVFTLKKCSTEFPRTKRREVVSVVVHGEKFEATHDDLWMEFLGEIKFNPDGDEIFVEFHGEPVGSQAAGPGLLQRAKDLVSGNKGEAKPGDKV